MAVSFGRLGFRVGRSALTGVSDERIGEFAGQLERAGYGAIWLGSASADLRFAEPVLSATSGLVYATGILNVWTEPAEAWSPASPARPSRQPSTVAAHDGRHQIIFDVTSMQHQLGRHS
jgi:hypothetical protein